MPAPSSILHTAVKISSSDNNLFSSTVESTLQKEITPINLISISGSRQTFICEATRAALDPSGAKQFGYYMPANAKNLNKIYNRGARRIWR